MEDDIQNDNWESMIVDESIDNSLGLHSSHNDNGENVDTIEANSTSRARQRVRQACDHCNSSRRKCDGRQPCGYCLRTRGRCDYTRKPKKRGKVPSTASKKTQSPASTQTEPAGNDNQAAPANEKPLSHLHQTSGSMETESQAMNLSPDLTFSPPNMLPEDHQNIFNLDMDWGMEGFGDTLDDYIPSWDPIDMANTCDETTKTIPQPLSAVPESIEPPEEGGSLHRKVTYGIHSFVEESSLVTDPASNQKDQLARPFEISRSGSMSKTVSNDIMPQSQQIKTNAQTTEISSASKDNNRLRYPVLAHTIHLLRPFIPDALSCDLLEAYFEISPATSAHLAPCVPPLIYRRYSFLGAEEPRHCSQALLVSMLWLSAQTANIPPLNDSIARRKYVRRKLLQLTTSLLKPLNEVSLSDNLQRRRPNPSHHSTNGAENPQSGPGVNHGLDEIMAYVHLAMVTSASDFKGASLRWWNIAFSLVREAKLYLELPDHKEGEADFTATSLPGSPPFGEAHIFASLMSEEVKEERRRVWWFLYAIDRHLSLSYNKPLALLDSECQSLRQPCDDDAWQSDQVFSPSSIQNVGYGPWFECTGPTFFGFFLPLTALLGEIVYFVGAQNHPRFGISQSTLLDWKQWEKGISDRLDAYEMSLQLLVQAQTSTSSAASPSYTHPETPISFRSQVVHAYAKVMIQILYVLLAGKWNASALLDRSNTWYSSPSFVVVVGHVVEAAKYAKILIDLDPETDFMPFFLGIYLLQGCVPLIVAADRLKDDVADVIIKACDTMIRVHEAHIIRMPSEYQILFVSVLRLALKEMQGRSFYVSGDPTTRYRQIFERYNWASEGRGLAG